MYTGFKAGVREPPEGKHPSRGRKRNQTRFPEYRRGKGEEPKPNLPGMTRERCGVSEGGICLPIHSSRTHLEWWAVEGESPVGKAVEGGAILQSTLP